MLRILKYYLICSAFGLSLILILAGSRYMDKTNYCRCSENNGNVRNFLKDVEEILLQPIPKQKFDGSPIIEKLLDKTRAEIRSELLAYNFTFSGVSKLEDLIMESGGRPMRSLIISTWRSGSTFLGDLLNAMPANFYHYEPLLYNKVIQIRGPPHADKALNTIKNMLQCVYDDMEDYFDYERSHLHQFIHNTRLWDHCKYNQNELCFDAHFTARFCKLFPFQSMKVVRVRLHLIEDILDDKTLNVKVVLLVRDPRGVMQSRQQSDFCQPSPDCWKPELLCADMISDYVAASRLLKKYPDKLMVLRYEELALNPNSTTQNLLKFLRLSSTKSIDEFLYSHTNMEMASAFSTYRVSRDVPFKWKNILNFNYVDEIQMACKNAMNLWGYRIAHSASHMTSKDFFPLEPYVIEQ